ncbi:AraC family transcriptional regulator [Rhizobium sp. AG855]|uniref:helix-turn-helix domain-containing protein n=1 Tax=Rhizobium sp. AG855 TaxID=2183898 RepID=UPI000E71D139|nr:AraC family transcriptional regulator [Rhizobium sp. AG855]RKE85572.1 AraC family transcriptional regulator [Rhizobium sp. AG855]
MDQESELQLRFREANGLAETHAAHNWRGLSAQYSRLKLPAEYEFEWHGNWHYLAYHDLVLVDGEMELTGEKPVAGGDLRDKMTYVPAGQSIEGWAKPANRMNAFTVVCFDPSAMEEEIQAEFNQFEPRPYIYFRDTQLGPTMRKLGELMADERPTSRIYAETVALTAALEMFRISIPPVAAQSRKVRGQLSASQRRLIAEYIDAHLTTDLGLDELANICGLTRFHFCRSFKATYGDTPFQYVTAKRIEKAQHMLRQSRLPVSFIAEACGFNGANQFGRAFRSHVGTTPLAYRKMT